MRPVVIPGNQVQARFRRGPKSSCRKRTGAGAQPCAFVLRAVACRCDRLDHRADGCRPSRRPILSAALQGAGCVAGAIEAAPSALGWASQLVRYELLLLAELGFGLDLETCAVSGSNDDLVAVSPRSGRAVSAAEAEPYAGKLLSFRISSARAARRHGKRSRDGLELSGHFLMRDILTGRSAGLVEARSRLVERSACRRTSRCLRASCLACW